MKKDTFLGNLRSNFFTGLAIVLPGVLSIGLFFWFFGTIANFTDTLLFFLPPAWTHQNNGEIGRAHV